MRKLAGFLMIAMVGVILFSFKSGSEPGIKFENYTFERAKKEAKKSGKLLFIDAYTDWCGPCRAMANGACKDENVGKAFDQSFVSIKIEMEKNPDGPEVARMYGVRAYPTLLVIDGDGKLVKQLIGMQSADRLIALAESVR